MTAPTYEAIVDRDGRPSVFCPTTGRIVARFLTAAEAEMHATRLNASLASTGGEPS